jgi:hypothetical protein
MCPSRGKLALYLFNRYDDNTQEEGQLVAKVYEIVDILAPGEMSIVSWLLIRNFFKNKPVLACILDKDLHDLTNMPKKVEPQKQVRPPKPKSYTWIARFLRQFPDVEEKCLASFVQLRLTSRDVVVNMSEASLIANKIEYATFLAMKLADPEACNLPDLPRVGSLVTTSMSRSTTGTVVDIHLDDLPDIKDYTNRAKPSKLPLGTATIQFKHDTLCWTLYAWPVDDLRLDPTNLPTNNNNTKLSQQELVNTYALVNKEATYNC